MNLSSDLISKFVKITKDEPKKSTESIVQGTTVEYNGSMYVQLDGSDVLTPVSTTSDMKNGERVTVLIKNHAATVTGNISSPSASSDDVKELGNQITEVEILVADKVTTQQLDAVSGRIDNLVSDNVAIKDTLSANTALIENLQAKDVEIEGELDANKATIEDLEANKLDVEIAEAQYATIESLEATNADIYNLNATYGEFVDLTTKDLTAKTAEINELKTNKLSASEADLKYATIEELDAESARIDKLDADVADIDTLIFGSASGTTIQTSFANAVIAQLGNAQIKSAMIENINASKINAGDINTNNIRVVSEDGNLVISDETIQISDGTRVRVQIGKDASNDYSINIWDAEGDLMFSEGGITDNAIKSAIIRNDMVSDNANISASKLDISSLFSEINGSTETIKANRIYLDSEKQTLDVSFTSMTNDLDNLDKTVSSQGTRLSVVEGNISSKVWQQDIDSAIDEVEGDISTLTTKQSSLEQNLNSVSATVSSHTTQIAGKANSSKVTSVENKVSSLEVSLDGFKTEVSETYAERDDVADLTNRVSTAESNIQQNSDSISMTVEKVENLDVGGRNLLRKSDASKWFDEWEALSDSFSTLLDDRWVEVSKTDSGSSFARIKLPCMSTIPEAGEYILSFDAYSSQIQDLNIDHLAIWTQDVSYGITKSIDVTIGTEPKRYSVLFSVSNAYENCTISIGSGDTRLGLNPFYIRDIMLEKGNLASDWSPAPEDVDESIDDVRSELTSKVDTSYADILVTSEQIILSALDSYVETSDYGAFKETVETQLTTMAGEITMNFTTTNEIIEELNGDLQSRFTELHKYIKYSGDTAITIGSGDSAITLEIDNETGIIFKKGGEPFGWWDGNDFHTGNIVVEVNERAQFGNFAFVPRNDGSLMLLKVGG